MCCKKRVLAHDPIPKHPAAIFTTHRSGISKHKQKKTFLPLSVLIFLAPKYETTQKEGKLISESEVERRGDPSALKFQFGMQPQTLVRLKF